MKIVFMGTPDFSIAPLVSLYNAGHDISLVVSMPDKPKGRGYVETATEVKKKAIELGLEVYQPITLKSEEAYEKLKSINADVFVVVAYGKIIPENILNIPKYGCINIHASLLPEYRGAAPIQWAIVDGKHKTGITTMQMDIGLDTGDILKQYEVEISNEETGGSLFDKLSDLGAFAIVDTLKSLEAGNIVPVPQGETNTEYARIINKKDGLLDFSMTATDIERRIRAFTPWPGTYTTYKGKILKIWKAEVLEKTDRAGLSEEYTENDLGRLIIKDESIFITCKDGILEVIELQLEGKKRMLSEEFLRGNKPDENIILGQ